MKNTHDTPGRWIHALRARKHALAREYSRNLDATAREGISDEDYETTMTTLETMARNLGWDESHGGPDGPPFGRGRRGPRVHQRKWHHRGWHHRGWHGHAHQHEHCQHEHEAREKPADV
ncbi:MAG: hypothetical protein KIT89_09750 [Microcella sp.]|uniref:hypothetical protein n=1 Tax=Microcella sp. TaxID=1913979 RepID=UPI0024CCBE9C|nr:hypothetical protein [Microcella sp.]UYN82988.1 MAG: hypothetical protein KIT89_09750 [Microcella sp.]